MSDVQAETSDVLDGWVFDVDFFQDVPHVDRQLDEGRMVAFRLVNSAGDEKFLHIFNAHNGYYSHGFTIEVGGEVLRSESL